jgi:murein DD-endopeptidase MepM/ murein hydrolase activator NlpD/beta-lactamase regulating signal transducer with metallopeptidase domain
MFPPGGAFPTDLPALILGFLSRQTLYTLAVFALLLPLFRLLKKRSPRWHYSLWLLILIRLVLPPDLSQPYSVRNMVLKTDAGKGLMKSLGPPLSFPAADLARFTPGAAKGQADNQKETATPFPLTAVLLFLWAAGAVFFLAQYARKIVIFIRETRRADPIKNEVLAKLLEAWTRRLRIRRPVRIVRSDRFSGPFTIGLFRPVIHLPSGLLEKGDPRLIEAVLAHEAAHIRRKDALFLIVENLLRIVYFFNPLVWTAASRIQLARECLCDHMVLSHKTFSAETYGNSLLAVLRNQRTGPGIAGVVPGMGIQGRHLQIRFKHLKGEHTLKKHPLFLTLVPVIFLGLLLLPMAGQKAQEKKEEIKAKSVKIKLDPQEIKLNVAVPLKIEVPKLIPEPAVAVKIDVQKMELKPAVALKVDVSELNLDPAVAVDVIPEPVLTEAKVLSDPPHAQKIRKAVAVSVKAGKKIQEKVKPSVNIKIHTKIAFFTNPVPGAYLASGFGKRLHPKTKEVMMHNGVDLAAEKGTPVLASADGMVIKTVAVTEDEAYGFYVILSHAEGYETLYSSLDEVLVTEGQEVRRGDVIGHVGETGQASGPHLHFELRKDGTPVDPATHIKFK